MNSKEITTQISEAAESLNLKKWDYGASFSNDYSVQVDKGEAKQLKASQKQILTIRVWNESNLVGITTTSDISESGIKKALNQANIASDFGNKNERTEFSPLAKDPIEVKDQKKINPVGIKKLLTLLREAEVKLLKSHESIKSVPYNGLSESSMREFMQIVMVPFVVIPKVKLHFIYMQEQKKIIRNLVAQVL